LAKNLNYSQKWKFWSKIEISDENGNFSQKGKLLFKNSNFGQKWKVWSKMGILVKKINFSKQ